MGNTGKWDGTITAMQFKAAAAQLVQRWQERYLDSPHLWRWQDASASLAALSDKVAGYVVLENVMVPTHRMPQPELADEDANAEDSLSYRDDATLVRGCESHLYTFHIVYSESYRVPVIYFKGYSSGDVRVDGSPLVWDEVLQDLLGTDHTIDENSKWTFVTQQEHPYLRRPWFCLHPCGTASMLALIFSQAGREADTCSGQESCRGQASQIRMSAEPVPANPGSSFSEETYLLAWLSLTGPILGMNVPYTLFK